MRLPVGGMVPVGKEPLPVKPISYTFKQSFESSRVIFERAAQVPNKRLMVHAHAALGRTLYENRRKHRKRAINTMAGVWSDLAQFRARDGKVHERDHVSDPARLGAKCIVISLAPSRSNGSRCVPRWLRTI